MGTQFSEIYNRFLNKITDDMYMELTPEDTIKDLRNLLIDAIPGFEFPRKVIDDYVLETLVVEENETKPDDFIIGVIWDELPEDADDEIPEVLIERSYFNAELTSEEINILAILYLFTFLLQVFSNNFRQLQLFSKYFIIRIWSPFAHSCSVKKCQFSHV